MTFIQVDHIKIPSIISEKLKVYHYKMIMEWNKDDKFTGVK